MVGRRDERRAVMVRGAASPLMSRGAVLRGGAELGLAATGEHGSTLQRCGRLRSPRLTGYSIVECEAMRCSSSSRRAQLVLVSLVRGSRLASSCLVLSPDPLGSAPLPPTSCPGRNICDSHCYTRASSKEAQPIEAHTTLLLPRYARISASTAAGHRKSGVRAAQLKGEREKRRLEHTRAQSTSQHVGNRLGRRQRLPGARW